MDTFSLSLYIYIYICVLYDLHLFLQVDDRHGFGQMLRMTPEEFDMLLGLVGQRIRKKDTAMRRAIPPDQRLSLTLRFLATGMSCIIYQCIISHIC